MTVYSYAEMLTELEAIQPGDQVWLGTSGQKLRAYQLGRRHLTALHLLSPRGIKVTLTSRKAGMSGVLWLTYPDDSEPGGTRSRRVNAVSVCDPNAQVPEATARILELERVMACWVVERDTAAREIAELQATLRHTNSKLDTISKAYAKAAEVHRAVKLREALFDRLVGRMYQAIHGKPITGETLSQLRVDPTTAAFEILAHGVGRSKAAP